MSNSISPAISAPLAAVALSASDPNAAIVSGVLVECAVDLSGPDCDPDAVCDAISAAAVTGWRGESLSGSDADDFALALAHSVGRQVAVGQGWLAAAA